MRFKDKYFPYPVIRPYYEDFTASTFDIELTQETKENDLIIDVKFNLNNDNIIKEIKLNNLHYVVHLEESETMYRHAHITTLDNSQIRVSLDLIRHEIEVTPFIVASNDIKDFKSSDLSAIYDDITIDYDKNNIIGIGSPMRIDVVKENDDIQSVGSIFMVVPSENIKNIFELSLEKERVVIKVSEETYVLYNNLSKSYRMTKSDNNVILLTLMVLPSFVETLNILKTDTKSYENYKWFHALIKAFENKGINIMAEFDKADFDSYKYAQIIFENIIHESINQLKVLSMLEG